VRERAGNRAQRQQRADAEVDPADEDDEQLADRQTGERRDLQAMLESLSPVRKNGDASVMITISSARISAGPNRMTRSERLSPRSEIGGPAGGRLS
jgi:hypothetical protein